MHIASDSQLIQPSIHNEHWTSYEKTVVDETEKVPAFIELNLGGNRQWDTMKRDECYDRVVRTYIKNLYFREKMAE